MPLGRELAAFCSSFNRMSKTLRKERDNLELKVTERTEELHAINRELTAAIADVKTLSGLIPICAACKKIRDDQGYWQQVESYITARSKASFSHGLCPECLPTYFPEQCQRTDQGDGEKPAS